MFGSNAKIKVNTLKQLTFFDTERLKGLSAKMLNLARKRLFTILSKNYFIVLDLPVQL